MLTVKDGAGSPQNVKTTVASGEHTPHVRVDVAALPTGASTEVTLASCLTQLQSAASNLASILSAIGLLPQASAAATEATLAEARTLIADVKSAVLAQATKLETQPVSIASTGHALDSSVQAITAALAGQIKVKGATDANASAGVSADVTTTADTTLVNAVSAKKSYVLRLTISNSGGADSYFNLKSGSTTIWSVFIKAGASDHFEFTRATAPETAVNTALVIAAGTATTFRVSWAAITE